LPGATPVDKATTNSCTGATEIGVAKAASDGDNCLEQCDAENDCTWATFYDGSCALYSGDCLDISEDTTSLTAFRPTGFVAPSTVEDVCTHTAATGRTPSSTCADLASDYYTCENTAGCHFNALPIVALATSPTCTGALEIGPATVVPDSAWCHSECLRDRTCTFATFVEPGTCTVYSGDCLDA
jgi:hypothetical protein